MYYLWHNPYACCIIHDRQHRTDLISCNWYNSMEYQNSSNLSTVINTTLEIKVLIETENGGTGKEQTTIAKIRGKLAGESRKNGHRRKRRPTKQSQRRVLGRLFLMSMETEFTRHDRGPSHPSLALSWRMWGMKQHHFKGNGNVTQLSVLACRFDNSMVLSTMA